MLKKLSCLFLGIAILLLLTAGSSDAISQNNGIDLPDEVVKLMELQTEALEAYDILRTTFTVNPDGSESYPDDFAGTWVNAPYLHIALTSNSPKTLERYQKLLKEYESIVVYETAKYSLNELNDIRYSVFKILAKEHPITKHYVDVIENKIVFEFLELNEKSINASISSAMRNTAFKNTLPSDLFIIKKGEPIILCYDVIGGA